jgi:hypothetical protein
MKSFEKKATKNAFKSLMVTSILLISRGCEAKSNFRGKTTSYGINVIATGLSTMLKYDLPSAHVKASPAKDWKVTNNNAVITSLLTPVAMTLSETHPKFDMKGTWPEYKIKMGKAQKPKKRLLDHRKSGHTSRRTNFRTRAKNILHKRRKEKRKKERSIFSAQ